VKLSFRGCHGIEPDMYVATFRGKTICYFRFELRFTSNCMVDFDPTLYDKSSKYPRKNLALNDVIWEYTGLLISP